MILAFDTVYEFRLQKLPVRTEKKKNQHLGTIVMKIQLNLPTRA
jgi:hypothetical protein